MFKQKQGKTGLILFLFAAVLGQGGCANTQVTDESDEFDGSGKADGQYGVKLGAVAPGDGIEVKVSNNYFVTPIYLPGCNPVSLEVQQGGAWVPVAPERTCVFEGLAVKVAPRTEQVEKLALKPAGTYRAKIEFKTGCKPSQLFSQCTGKLRTLTSGSFTVAAAADPACDAFQDWAYDNCVPDDDDPVNWDWCFSNYEGGEFVQAAAQCCQADSGYLWCDQLPQDTTACDDFQDWAYDNCVPDDDDPVDWDWCFSNYAGGEFGQGAQCCQAADYLWCSSLIP